MNTYLKGVIILFGIISFTVKNAEAQSYSTNFKADICQCLEEKQSTTRTIERDYNACFKKHLVSYAPLIDAGIDIEDKNLKYLEGQKIRGNLGLKFKYELMYSCNIYFYAFERATYASKQKSKQQGDSIKLQKMHELVAMKPHWNSYVLRAKEYYSLNSLKKAEQDILKSIELSPYKDNVVQLRAQRLFLSQIYEDQKRYDEALKLYDGIILGDFDYQTQILKAIVARKKSGNYNPPAIDANQNINTTQTTKSSGENQNDVKKKPSITPKTDNSKRRSSRNIPVQKDTSKVKVAKPIKSEKTEKKELRSLFKLD